MDAKKRILIVDDNESICSTLAFIFGKKEYETDTATTGQEALQKARAGFYNLALIDIKLPDAEGTVLLSHLKDLHPDMATIVLTGYASLETAVQALNKGASAYVIKPFNVPELVAAAQRALESQHLVMENRRLLDEMRKELQERERVEQELAKYREHLEDLVTERTAELKEANAKLTDEVMERQNIELKLKEAIFDLEAFCYSVSHDLRAPLRAIDGFSRAVMEHHAARLDDEGKRFLNIINDSARRMGQLIKNLLDFSFMGRKELDRAAVDANQLVSEVSEELRSADPGRQVTFDIRELPEMCADRAMMREVFGNLLGNAFKFTRRNDNAVVEVGGHDGEKENVYYVKDNGVGFDMQYAGKLFGVFERLHPADDFEGTGVGLAIVQRVIHRHGGRVWAESAVDKGATFSFTVPKKGAEMP